MKPLVIAYHFEPFVFAPLGDAAEVRTVIAKDGGDYLQLGAGVVQPVGRIDRPVVLVGWSAGAQAVRAHIRGGDLASVVGIVDLDGAHAHKPPLDVDLSPWRSVLADPALHVTMTSTRIPVPYSSTREVLGMLGLPTDDGVFERDGGRIRIVNTPGTDAAAHIAHNRMAPGEVARILGVTLVAGQAAPPPQPEGASKKWLWAIPAIGVGYALYRWAFP